MHRLLPLALLAALPACDIVRSLEGSWTGECTIDGSNDDDDPFVVPFSLLVEEDDGYDVWGEGSFEWGDDAFSGPLEGERFDDELELVLDGSHDGESVRLDIYGVLTGDRVVGDCAFYGVEGELKMSRSKAGK